MTGNPAAEGTGYVLFKVTQKTLNMCKVGIKNVITGELKCSTILYDRFKVFISDIFVDIIILNR